MTKQDKKDNFSIKKVNKIITIMLKAKQEMREKADFNDNDYIRMLEILKYNVDCELEAKKREIKTQEKSFFNN